MSFERSTELHTPWRPSAPYVMDRELVLEIQERHRVPSQVAIVIRTGQQVMLHDGARQFLRKVEFDAGGHDVRRLRSAGKLVWPVPKQ